MPEARLSASRHRYEAYDLARPNRMPRRKYGHMQKPIPPVKPEKCRLCRLKRPCPVHGRAEHSE